MSKVYRPLPNKLYQVKVPLYTLYSEEELEVVGIPLEESSDGDITAIEDKMSVVMLPITKIIDIYSGGAPIYLLNSKEVTDFYSVLEEYLGSSNSSGRILNATVIEESRMHDIDKFAEEVFNLNKANLAEDINSRKSGFDLNIPMLDVSAITQTELVKGRPTIMEAYKNENQQPRNSVLDSYLNNKRDLVSADDLIRKPKTRRRRVSTLEK